MHKNQNPLILIDVSYILIAYIYYILSITKSHLCFLITIFVFWPLIWKQTWSFEKKFFFLNSLVRQIHWCITWFVSNINEFLLYYLFKIYEILKESAKKLPMPILLMFADADSIKKCRFLPMSILSKNADADFIKKCRFLPMPINRHMTSFWTGSH